MQRPHPSFDESGVVSCWCGKVNGVIINREGTGGMKWALIATALDHCSSTAL